VKEKRSIIKTGQCIGFDTFGSGAGAKKTLTPA